MKRLFSKSIFIITLMSSLLLSSCSSIISFFTTQTNNSSYESTTIDEVLHTSSLLNTSTHTHSYGNYEYNSVEHYHVCLECGEILDKENHNFSEVVTKEATILEYGEKKCTCTICGYTKTVKIPPITHIHLYNQVNTDLEYLCSEATCTEPAYYYYSCECGKKGENIFSYGEALGHHVVIDERVEPTEESQGLTEGSHCDRCGHVFVTQEVIPAIGLEYNPEEGNSKYGYEYFGTLENGIKLQRLYLMMNEACKQLNNSRNNVTSFVPTNSGNCYYIGTMNYKSLGISLNEAISVWAVFTTEAPYYYYLSNRIVWNSDTMYLTIDSTYNSYSNRLNYYRDIQNMKEDCSSGLNDSLTEIGKFKYIHDYIANRIDYAYVGNSNVPEDSIWAHNLIGASTKFKGVCETYSKTFQYLSLVNNLKSIIVVGTAFADGISEGHAWNYMYIRESNSWYAVDVTWDDQTRIIYDYFGMGKATADNSRIPNGQEYGKDFYFAPPVLANENLSL